VTRQPSRFWEILPSAIKKQSSEVFQTRKLPINGFSSVGLERHKDIKYLLGILKKLKQMYLKKKNFTNVYLGFESSLLEKK
jgi:hypothetical protein